jgi:hypothetical protein
MTKKILPPVKTPVDTDVVREELRVLQSAVAETDTPANWITPEFVAMVSSVAVNLVTAATVLGWIDAGAAQEITKATTAVIAAVGTISVNGLIVWRYLAGRETVKREAIQAKYRYASDVAVERLRASNGW